MGHPILQIPEDRPTELLELQFSLLEDDLYRKTRDKLHDLRELAKASRGTRPNDSPPIQKGELKKLFNYLRFFTSHPALVEPKYLSLEARRAQTPQLDVQVHQPDVQPPQTDVQAPQAEVLVLPLDVQTTQLDAQVTNEGGKHAAFHYFCTLCCNALVKPLIGNVSVLFCPANGCFS